jgi:hypothetical protein
MSQKVELSNGGWAILRDPAAVSVKNRRPVEKVLMAIGRGQAKAALNQDPATAGSELDPAIVDQFYELNDLLIVARLESWSFDLPISVDSLGDLVQDDYVLLQKIAAENVTSMVPNFGLSNDPSSPTLPSGA